MNASLPSPKTLTTTIPPPDDFPQPILLIFKSLKLFPLLTSSQSPHPRTTGRETINNPSPTAQGSTKSGAGKADAAPDLNGCGYHGESGRGRERSVRRCREVWCFRAGAQRAERGRGSGARTGGAEERRGMNEQRPMARGNRDE
jgi:hypothetical protein